MKNITRTLNRYQIRAFDIVENENGEPELSVIAETVAEATGMTKTDARAALSANTGVRIPKGTTIKFAPVGSVTYAMPLEEFVDQAMIIEQSATEQSATEEN